MIEPQRLWWLQASSDHQVLLLLRHNRSEPCHQLHYLQMVTEKLAKAYFWRDGHPLSKSHRAFLKFLLAINSRSKSERQRIASLFGYKDADQLGWAITRITPLAYGLERLAPALAGDSGPNPEYPWPTSWPAEAPTTHQFAIWADLSTGVGRSLLQFIDRAVVTFPQYN